MTRVFVYAIGTEAGPVKVGITANLISRLQSLQTGSAAKLDLIYVYTAVHRQEARDMEQWFHRTWEEWRLAGEWFDVSAEQAIESLDGQIDIAIGAHGKEFHAKRNEYWQRLASSDRRGV